MLASNEEMLDTYKSPEACAEDLDAALDNMLFESNGKFKPKTCFCCDCFLLSKEQHSRIFGLA
jgi:hypothetical protein